MKYKGEFDFREVFELKVPEGEYLDVFRFKNWRHRIELGNGVVSPGYISEYTWHNAHFPTDLKGKSVLDVGANDGLNAFIAEKMGASAITAIDIYEHLDTADHQAGWNPTAIEMAKKYIQSKVDVQNLSIYNVDQLGKRFDHVIVADVVTWLTDIPTALRAVANICDERLIIREGLLKGDDKQPMLRYDFAATGTHMYTPNKQFFRDILGELGFKKVEFKQIAHSVLYDHWVASYPMILSENKVKVYLDPWSKDVVEELPNLKGQSLLKVGNRYCLRSKGWVDADSVKEMIIKSGFTANALRKIVGYELYMTIKDMRYNYPRDSVTIIATR